MAIEISDLGMVEVGKVVVIAVNNDGSRFNRASMVSVRWLSTNDLGETKCQKADTGHKNRNYTNQPHFLSPRTLLLGAADT